MVFDVGDSLLKRQTPEEWLKKWEGPPDPTVYLQGLVRRALSIKEWEKRVKSIFDSPLDLSDLLNPDTFLGAFKQQCARKLGVSMDELVFVCMWESGKSSMSQGINCKLTGLLLEGCSFDGLKLTENSSESLPIIKIPDCSITWVSHEDANRVKSGYTISVPLYYNETRDRIIGSLDLPSSGDHAKWIQAGVAAFLKT
jgi:dynein heavy chain 2